MKKKKMKKKKFEIVTAHTENMYLATWHCGAP